MHADRYCGEFINTILNKNYPLLWDYLPPSRALQAFHNALVEVVGDQSPSDPVPSDRIWRKLEDEIICHSCYQDYIKVLQAHPPKNAAATIADCSSLLGDGFAGAGVGAGGSDPVVDGGDVEVDEEQDEADADKMQIEMHKLKRWLQMDCLCYVCAWDWN
jgi:hypothetical protein